MKSVLNIFFIFFCSFSTLKNYAQSCMDTAWRKTFNSNSSVNSNSITLKNGNYLLNQYNYNTTDNTRRSSLMLITKNGSILWNCRFITQVENDGIYIHQIIECGNGDIITIGLYISNNNIIGKQQKGLFISRINNVGNLLWQKVHWLSQGTNFDDTIIIQSIVEDEETGYVYAGVYSENSFSEGSSIIAFSSSGDIVWNKNFEYLANSSPDKIEFLSYSGLHIINNELLVFAEGNLPTSPNKSILLTEKINKKTGSFISAKFYEHLLSASAGADNGIIIEAFAKSSVKINDNNFIFFGKPSKQSLQYGFLAKLSAEGIFINGADFITKPDHQMLYSKISQLFVTKEGLIATVIKGNYSSLSDLYFNVYSSSYNLLQQQKIVSPPLVYGNTLGHQGIFESVDGKYFNVAINYETINKNNFFGINRIFLGQQGNSECFGLDGFSENIIPMEVLETEDFTVSEKNISSFIIPSVVFLQNEMANVIDICNLPSRCDSLKISGRSVVCNTSDTILYKAAKGNACYKVINWKIDSAAFKYFAVENDSSIKIKFVAGWHGKLYASIGNCNIYDSLQIDVFDSPINFTLGNDKVLCKDSNIILKAPLGYKATIWDNGSMAGSRVISQPGVYYLKAINYCGNIITDTINITPSAFTLAAGKDTFICNKDTLTLKVSDDFNSLTWRPNYNISSTSMAEVKVWPHTNSIYVVTANSPDGCTMSDSISISYKLAPYVSLQKKINICKGDSTLLNAGDSFSNYLWNTGANTSSIWVKTNGNFSVITLTQNGCKSKDSTNIVVHNLPVNFTLPLVNLCTGESIYLKTTGDNYEKYLWSTGSVLPSILISKKGVYGLQVTDKFGCKAKETIVVKEIDCRKNIFFPSAFTPNNDFKNDRFQPLIFGLLKQYNLTIYNRLGQMVFQSSDYHKTWDGTVKGKMQENGVYVWKCIYKFEAESLRLEKGTIMLIR